jgi:phosphotransferase system enzyme I (PtsI)
MPTDENRDTTETTLQGIAASPGIAHGQVFLHLQTDLELPAHDIEPERRGEEAGRFERALLETRQQVQRIKGEVEKNLGADEARIFDAHLMVLEDQALIGETLRELETTGHNIERCFHLVAQRYIAAFESIEDEYLRERAGDIRDVAQRVLHNLLGRAAQSLGELARGRVVVAGDITPSEAAGLDRSAALAIVTDSGSKTSHAVIVARSMRVPAVVGTRDLTRLVRNGDRVLVDGYEGKIVLHPSEQTLFRYGQIKLEKKTIEQRLLAASRQPAVTRDGAAVTLRANIEQAGETALAREFNADGVGLFRTEFLFLSSPRVPTEEEQYAAYRAAAESLAPAPVVIRTLDLGGDKPMAGGAHLFAREANPFLGHRAIRFCLDHPGIFKDQLRAILRASAHGNVHLMYPMISGREELARANAVLDECRAELTAKGVAFNATMPVGSMIEIPSAALTADLLAKDCDFFSIGTNDLIQYLLAIDRVNERIAHLYEPTHPAVLRILKHIVTQAHKRKRKVSVCGEMAGDPVYAALLLGLGVDELSMTPPLLPAVKFAVRAMKLSDAKKLAKDSLNLKSAKEIQALCEKFHHTRVQVG